MKKILYFSTLWPRENLSAAGVRTMNIINCFIKNNMEVTFVTPQNENNNYAKELKQKCKIKTIKVNDNENFKKELIFENPSLVIFDTFVSEELFSWQVKELFPNSLLVCDTQGKIKFFINLKILEV
jgi:O-antigen biosynthesis protein